MTRTKSEWTTDYYGRYVSRYQGWVIRRKGDLDYKEEWLVINPATDRVVESFDTLRAAKWAYHRRAGEVESIADRERLNSLWWS